MVGCILGLAVVGCRRNQEAAEWEKLDPEQRGQLLARQGQGYVTSELVRRYDGGYAMK